MKPMFLLLVVCLVSLYPREEGRLNSCAALEGARQICCSNFVEFEETAAQSKGAGPAGQTPAVR